MTAPTAPRVLTAKEIEDFEPPVLAAWGRSKDGIGLKTILDSHEALRAERDQTTRDLVTTRARVSAIEAALREIADQEPCSCHCGLPVEMSERAREALEGK